MNHAVFIESIRETAFGGKITAGQLEGLTKILDYRDTTWPNMPDDELAYLLATAKWETAHTMQPVQEYGSQRYLRSKKYWPWVGRGLVQITWKSNYLKYGILNPADALTWPVALHVIFDGMIKGKFTGKKLADYIDGDKRDYVGARRIINGVDKKHQIAAIAEQFADALDAARSVSPVPEASTTMPAPEPDPVQLPKPVKKSTTILAQIVQWIASGGAAAAAALGQVDWRIAAVVGAVVVIGAGLWIIRERLNKQVAQ